MATTNNEKAPGAENTQGQTQQDIIPFGARETTVPSEVSESRVGCAGDDANPDGVRLGADYGTISQPPPVTGNSIYSADPRFDVVSVRLMWAWVKAAGCCVELRAITPEKVIVSGYFDDEEAFVKAVARLNGRGNIYVTLNPVPLDFMARGPNVLRGSWKAVKAGLAELEVDRVVTTADDDIRVERRFVIDLDPRRPSGISSTDAEVAAAELVARAIKADFAERKIESVLVMTGNGHHIHVALPEQPMTKAVKARRQLILQHLAERFGTDAVDIDVSVFSPGQIVKVPGTLAMKGQDCPDYGRPHRVSRFVEPLPQGTSDLHKAFTNNDLGSTERDATGDTTKRAATAKKTAAKGQDCECSYEIEKLLKNAGFEVHLKDKADWQVYELDTCPVSPDHQAREATVSVNKTTGAVAFNCHHSGGADWNWGRFVQWLKTEKEINAAAYRRGGNGGGGGTATEDEPGKPVLIIPSRGAPVTLQGVAGDVGRRFASRQDIFVRGDTGGVGQVQVLDTKRRLSILSPDRCQATIRN